jgi:Flp pilus assembly pilin Flp
MSLVTDSTGFAPWTGYAVLVGWVTVLLVGATVLLKRRDV